MRPDAPRVRALKVAIVLTALFNLLGLLVLLRGTPRVFTLFMFVGQPLFVIAVIVLVVVVLSDLRAKELL
jgi:hypothetical protein